jgi:aryl sulfotransferase
MANLTWLASYPKSGNTWMRILLANARAGGPVDINNLSRHGMPGGFSRAMFDRYCGLKSSTLPASVVERLRPDVYRTVAARATAPLVLKVHDAWRATARGEPLFPADVTAGVIYVLRNVLDVAASAADHWGVDCATAVTRLCDPDLGRESGGDALLPGVRQILGSWSSHIESWVDRSGLPLLLVRYEDMIADTEDALDRVIAFQRWDIDRETITQAVINSRFTHLQGSERASGFRETSRKARTLFFRRGHVNSWRDELAPDLVRRLVDAHGDMMRRFGYLADGGYPLEFPDE